MPPSDYSKVGPWFAEDGADRWQVWDDAGLACICDVHPGVEPDPSGKVHARLIASAPELLAACELLLEAQHRADNGDGRGGFELYCDAVEAASAAVKKVKGEA